MALLKPNTFLFIVGVFTIFSGGNRATLYAFEKTGARTKAEANGLDPEFEYVARRGGLCLAGERSCS